MQLAQDGHQPLLMYPPLGLVQRLAGAELGQDIVHVGQRQPWVQRLLPFAVGVQLFGQGADGGALGVAGVGKGEGLEAAGLVVARPILQRAARRQRPRHVDGAGEDAEVVGVVKAECDECAVGCGSRRYKGKIAVLRSFDCDNVSCQLAREFTKHRSRMTNYPPLLAENPVSVHISKGLNLNQ